MAQPHCVVYDGHTPHAAADDPAAALAAARASGGMLLVTLSSPTDDQVRELAETLDLEPLGVASALRTHQRSKLDHYGEHVFLVLQAAQYDDDAETVVCHEVDVVVGDDFFVAISPDAQVDFDRLLSMLGDYPQVLDHGAYGVLWATLEFVTRGYRDVLDGVENDIDEIEEQLFGERDDVSHRIFALQREVIDLGHATAPMEDMLTRLQHIVEGRAHVAEAPAFHELADRSRYVDARVSAFRSTLDNALVIHSTIIDQARNEQMAEMTRRGIQQNDQVKKISSWAAIGFAPTLVASIYGMNFRYMPELDQPWGYPLAIGLMIAVSAGLYAVFKKNDWL